MTSRFFSRLACLPRLGLGTCLLLGLATAHSALAQSSASSENLLDYWLARQADRQPMPTDWAYAYVERRDFESGSRDSAFRQRRLEAELDGLALALRLTPHASLAEHIAEWQHSLDASAVQRSPGRIDVAWLAANPRHVPDLAELERIGTCQRPAWVEVWSLDGVTRLDWHSGMQSGELLAALTERTRELTQTASLVSPMGDVHRFGVAPWNYATLPVAPGSRVWLDLPDDLAPGQATLTHWLNTAMPEALAGKLPGDDCTTLWQRDAATTDSPE